MSKSATSDRSKIAMDHPDEVKYWIKHFGVTLEELRHTVERVGNSASAVRKEIQNRKVETPPTHSTE
ncbi:MAG: DUF3606 domain-containing protein [Xanthobacteraceae bacterium]